MLGLVAAHIQVSKRPIPTYNYFGVDSSTFWNLSGWMALGRGVKDLLMSGTCCFDR